MYRQEQIVIELDVEQAVDLLEFLKESTNRTNDGVDFVIELLEYSLDELEFDYEEED